MSEDCHDSNNFEELRGKYPDHEVDALNDAFIAVKCTYCGEEVAAFEAYPVELEHIDGTIEVAIFHSDFARSCPLKWAAKRLEKANELLIKMTDILEQTVKEIRAGAKTT